MARVYKVKNNMKYIEGSDIPSISGVSIITITNRPKYIDKVFSNFLQQNYIKKELIVILHGNHMDLKEYEKRAKQYNNIKVFQFDETTHYGICCNYAFQQTSYEYIAIFDDDDYYAPNYLKQSINIFANKTCDIVGKRSFYVYFEKSKTLAVCFSGFENQYVDGVADSSMVIKRQLLEKLNFPCPPNEGVLTVFQMNCVKQGYKLYSADRYNYVVHRHPIPDTDHSWKISEDELMKYCKIYKRNIGNYSSYISS